MFAPDGPLLNRTPQAWITQALANFDAVLCDHAHCEKKAAASAMALVSAYPEHDVLVARMVRLATEELRHFRQVHTIILKRGLSLTRDSADHYAKNLLALVRKPHEPRRTDRLLVSALIEARSCERLQLLADALEDSELRDFYGRLATAEAGHYRLFVDLAAMYEDPAQVGARLQELALHEAQIVSSLPIAPRIH